MTTASVNRQWLLARRPQGMVREDNFQLVESPVPVPDLEAGEILVRTLMLSFDPAQRGWMEDVPSYLPPVAIGEPMRASAIAQVVQSENPAFPEGSLVQGLFGWQDYAIANQGGMAPVPVARDVPLHVRLGVLGGASLTAWFGLYDIGALKAGDTVVVSAAAGAVGSMAVQIAKIQGARVIGIAGGAEKCSWVTGLYGADAAIDYKSENVAARLAELCPDGVDLFFDNVGGEILEAVIANIAPFGRIVLCGAISGYNDAAPTPGPRNMMLLIARRVRMQGFILLDHLHQAATALEALSKWVGEGRIRYREDIQQGFENIPRTLLRLFRGENRGKQLLQIAEPED